MAANRWDGLIDFWDERLRRAFLEAVSRLRDGARLDEIERMLRRGDIEGALRATHLHEIALRGFDRAFEEAFEAGGNATANMVPAAVSGDGLRVVAQFNIRNPAAERWLRDHSSTLIREILDDQRQMIRTALSEAMREGVNPRTAALDLIGRIGATGRREGGLIGLTGSQEAWVRKYAEELAGDNPLSALGRALRDRRFDPAVRKAAASGEPIPADLRAKMVAAYKNRALRFRAEAIARTEAMRALHQSQEEAMRQAIDAGAVQAQDVQFVWRTAHDDRVRDTHRTMDGQTRPIGAPFVTGSGARLRYPGDPAGPPHETIQCRCFREPKIDFLRGIR